jgi:hypothetical protein
MLKFKGQKILKSAPDEYKCQCCGALKSLNVSNFQIVNQFKYGFSTYCNECNEDSKKIKKIENSK